MALFISPCGQSTSLETEPMSVPVGVSDCGTVGTLTTSRVSNARVREGEWLIGMVSSGVVVCDDICWEVATSLDVAETGLSALSGSFALMVIGAPRATDVGLLRLVFPEAGLEGSSTT